MKKVLIAVLFAGFYSGVAVAQKDTAKAVTIDHDNIVKINLSALVFKNISVQYERKVAKRLSVALNVHGIPFGKIPFEKQIEKSINDTTVPISKFRFGSFGFTPELRFYVGKKGALRGFYLGPFINYNKYKTDLPITYDNDTKTGIFSGKVSAITFGLQLGAQWKLGKRVTLDWWIVGPNFGTCTGDLAFAATLSPSDQADLNSNLEDVSKDDAFKNIIKSYSVSSNGASIKMKGPWLGLRGLGFNLGYRF